MKYSDLKQLATPTPWRIENAVLCVPLHSEQGPPNWGTMVEEANAMLAKHCVENFDEVVEALEALLPMWKSGIDEPWVRKAEAVLARAKEIK